jgi:hypothetical protein
MSDSTYFKQKRPNGDQPAFVRAVFTSGQVQFSNAGGGFVHEAPEAQFRADFEPVTAQEWGDYIRPRNLSTVACDDGPSYCCYVSDMRWNGWEQPAFPAMSALAVAKDNSDGEYYSFFVERGGVQIPIADVSHLEPADVIVLHDHNDPDEGTERITPQTVNGETTWGIGAGRWIWSEVEPEDDEIDWDDELLAPGEHADSSALSNG